MIALTSVTFRALNASQVISSALEAGIRAIEWGGDVHVPAGDSSTAAHVRRLCEESGVKVLSYGSYFGLLSGMDFTPWLDSALTLGTKDIRVWAGNFRAMKSAYTKDEMDAAVSELNGVCREALNAGVTVHLEKHRGTLTQSPEMARELIDRAKSPNLRSYWQPNPELSAEDNLAAISTLAGLISKVHAFNWTAQNERMPLSDGAGDWTRYAAKLGQRDYIIEFVRGNSPEQLVLDAKALRGWLS